MADFSPSLESKKLDQTASSNIEDSFDNFRDDCFVYLGHTGPEDLGHFGPSHDTEICLNGDYLILGVLQPLLCDIFRLNCPLLVFFDYGTGGLAFISHLDGGCS